MCGSERLLADVAVLVGRRPTAVGADAPLAVRGVSDIVNDLVSNTLGAVLVAAFGTGYLDRPVAYARTLLE